MRTLVDIPEEDIALLDALAARDKCSRAATIREAVRLYLANSASSDWIERGYGYWADRAEIADGLAYQAAIRGDRAGFR